MKGVLDTAGNTVSLLREVHSKDVEYSNRSVL